VILEKVFELGHFVAVRDDGETHVVAYEGSPLWRAGFYALAADDLPAVTARRSALPEDFARGVGEEEREQGRWSPAARVCWCARCAAARSSLGTAEFLAHAPDDA